MTMLLYLFLNVQHFFTSKEFKGPKEIEIEEILTPYQNKFFEQYLY